MWGPFLCEDLSFAVVYCFWLAWKNPICVLLLFCFSLLPLFFFFCFFYVMSHQRQKLSCCDFLGSYQSNKYQTLHGTNTYWALHMHTPSMTLNIFEGQNDIKPWIDLLQKIQICWTPTVCEIVFWCPWKDDTCPSAAIVCCQYNQESLSKQGITISYFVIFFKWKMIYMSLWNE